MQDICLILYSNLRFFNKTIVLYDRERFKGID